MHQIETFVSASVSGQQNGGHAVSAYEQMMRDKAIRMVHRDHEDPDLSSSALATSLGISRRQVDRFFEGGASVSRVMLEFRLLTAAHRLLMHAGHTVLEVAVESGFGDVNTFRAHFREAFGVTPSEFRREHGRTSP